MFTQHWGTDGFRRCSLKPGLVVAMMLSGVLLLPAAARGQQCNANLLNVTISADTEAQAGETVDYTILATNPDSFGSQIGCDATDVTVVFYCPGANGLPNLSNPIVIVPEPGLDFPADDDDPSDITNLGTVQCVMPNTEFAIARVVAEGDVQFPAGPVPFDIARNVITVLQECVVQVDKQVSCDGGLTWVDQGLVVTNEDGTLSCNGVNNTAPAIQVRYQVKNAGDVPLYACTLDDTNNAFDLDPDGVLITSPLGVGVTTPLTLAPGQPLCSDALDANEPNTASVNCFCTSSLDPELKVSASDSADINCAEIPGLTVVKECPDANNDGTDEITVTVTAGAGDLGFANCTVTDSIFLDDPTCPANVGSGTDLALAPAGPFTLAPSGNAVFTGTVALTADACNTVSVTCTPETPAGLPPLPPVTATDDAVCPGAGEGCLTRTPGFWGNHPAITAQFLEVEVCGVTLDSTAANDTSSATEAICSVGRDGKILGPQLTQLVRQCTAAALNIAASVEGGGNCSTDFPNLTEQFASCCGDQSICSGDAVEDFTIAGCIETLDAFNNSIDTLPAFGDFVSPGPADSSFCRDSRNNGVVVTPVP